MLLVWHGYYPEINKPRPVIVAPAREQDEAEILVPRLITYRVKEVIIREE